MYRRLNNDTHREIIKFYDDNKNNMIDIPIEEIILTEYIHRKVKKENIEDVKNKPTDNIKVICRKLYNGKDGLVMGWRDYQVAVRLGIKNIKGIIIDCDREKFLSQLYNKDISKNYTQPKYDKLIDINKIKIPNDFQKISPATYKLQKALDFYNNAGFLDKPITCSHNLVLINGYTRCLVEKMLNVQKIPVNFV